MDLRDLKYFEVIAEEGHLGRAAKRLFRSQPALTKCVHRLEQTLGAKLFERAGRGIQLTPVGEVLLARYRQLNIVIEDTAREISDFARGIQGHVRVGCSATPAEHLLPGLFQELLSEAKDVTLQVMVAMNDALLEALKDGKLDLIIGPVLEHDPALESLTIIEDEAVVVASKSHEIFNGPATMRDLLKYRWALPAQTVGTRQWLDRAFDLQGLPRPDVQIEPDVISLLLPMIEKTGLLGFISRVSLQSGRAATMLREVPLKETTMHRRIGLTYRKDSYLSPAAQRLVDLLIERGSQLFLER